VDNADVERRIDGAPHKRNVYPSVFFQENDIMLTMSAGPNPTSSTFSPLFGIWSDVTGVYGEAIKDNTQHLLLSSSRVVQEQIIQAFVSFSMSCTEALAKNAMSVQEQSMKRFAEANGKAVGMMGQGFVRSWMDGMRVVTRG